MNCQDMARILDDRDIGSLAASEQRDVRAHLETCPDCARDWRIHAELSAEAIPPVPAELRAHFAALGEGGRHQGARRGRLIVVGGLLAVAAAAAMLAVRKDEPPAPVAYIEATVQEEASVVQVYGETTATPEESVPDDETRAMDDWKQRVADWLAVRDDPDALLTAALLNMRQYALRAELVRRAAELAPNSARIQATAMMLCFAPCDPQPYEQALQKLASDNALGWAAAAHRAIEADDRQALERALTAMSRARTFDTYEGATMVAMTSQIRSALVPPPDVEGYMPAMAAIRAFTAMPIPHYSPITKTCKTATDERTLIECRQIGAAMRRGDTMLTNALGLTVSGSGLPADSPEARSLAQETIRFRWIDRSSQIAFGRQDDPDGYLNTFADHPRALDALRAYLEARGMPTEPPPGWKPK